jgi:hypothetical protein
MCRAMRYIICVAVVLSTVVNVSATEWANTTGNGKWGTGANWSSGAAPVMNGDSITGNAVINLTGSNACVVDGTQAQAFCTWMHVGSIGPGTLNVVAGGKIGVPTSNPFQAFVGEAGSAGVVNIDGAGTVMRAEQWLIGSAAGDGSGVVNITNGGEMISVWWGMHVYSTGTINIISGKMTILGAGPFVIDNGGLIKISGASTLTLDTDRTAEMSALIAGGKITGSSSRCPVTVAFDEDYNVTHVTVVGCTCTTFSLGDFNHDCYVDFSDFVILANGWLSCTDPADSSCL